MFWSELVRHAHIFICGWVRWFFLNQICWRGPKPKLIRWGKTERSVQQIHVVLGNLLYFCWLDTLSTRLVCSLLRCDLLLQHTHLHKRVSGMSFWWISTMINICSSFIVPSFRVIRLPAEERWLLEQDSVSKRLFLFLQMMTIQTRTVQHTLS